MRNTYLLLSLFFCSFLFLSLSVEENVFTKIFFIDGQGDPDLPEVPFDYSNISLPGHLAESPYGQNDTTALADGITNKGATLGRVLFYDELLSANENLSCATCHQQKLSFADSNPFSQGVSEETERNSMQLNDLGWSNNAGFFWDLSQGGLESMIALPLENENEIGIINMEGLIAKMEQTSYYPQLFEDAFNESEITLLRIQVALGQFIRSMVTFESRFDQVERGDAVFSSSEALGRELFTMSCEICHTDGANIFNIMGGDYPGNILFAPFIFSNEMEDDNDPGAGGWDPSLAGCFKSPTLRNIDLTAPYMHDGRFETLREVIDHYSEDIGPTEWGILPEGGFRFTEGEKIALEDFLKTLTDERFIAEERWSDPFGNVAVSSGEVEEVIFNTSIFPNPSNGLTYVQFDNPTSRKVEAYLVNMEGQLVRKLTTHKNGLMTDVSQLPAGMYLVRIKNGEDFLDKKLIVQ